MNRDLTQGLETECNHQFFLGKIFGTFFFKRKTKVALTIQVQAGHFGLSKVELKEDDQLG